MRIGIFADAHDHLDYLRRAVECFNANECDLVLFAGDLVSTFAIPPLRKLKSRFLGCFGDNEGNKTGLLAGITIVGQFGEPPLGIKLPDGTRVLLAHMERQLRGADDEFDVAIYAHTHRPSVSRDAQGRLHINPGETSGWTFGNPTVVIFDTAPQRVQVMSLKTGKEIPRAEFDARQRRPERPLPAEK